MKKITLDLNFVAVVAVDKYIVIRHLSCVTV